jgi:hypothetical protein
LKLFDTSKVFPLRKLSHKIPSKNPLPMFIQKNPNENSKGIPAKLQNN